MGSLEINHNCLIQKWTHNSLWSEVEVLAVVGDVHTHRDRFVGIRLYVCVGGKGRQVATRSVSDAESWRTDVRLVRPRVPCFVVVRVRVPKFCDDL